MTITITPSGGSATTLCAGATRSPDGTPAGPDALTGTLTPGIRDRAYVNAQGIEPEATGTDRNRISFTVTRTYPTPTDALAYLTGSFLTEPITGELKLNSTTIITKAAIRTRSFSHIGCTIAIHYQIEGY